MMKQCSNWLGELAWSTILEDATTENEVKTLLRSLAALGMC